MADPVVFLPSPPDLEALGREDLLDWLDRTRLLLSRLDAEEPEDMGSEEYEHWGDCHEALEDLADDILDRLEELEQL